MHTHTQTHSRTHTQASKHADTIYRIQPITGEVQRSSLGYKVAQTMTLSDLDATGARPLLLLSTDAKVCVCVLASMRLCLRGHVCMLGCVGVRKSVHARVCTSVCARMQSWASACACLVK